MATTDRARQPNIRLIIPMECDERVLGHGHINKGFRPHNSRYKSGQQQKNGDVKRGAIHSFKVGDVIVFKAAECVGNPFGVHYPPSLISATVEKVEGEEIVAVYYKDGLFRAFHGFAACFRKKDG